MACATQTSPNFLVFRKDYEKIVEGEQPPSPHTIAAVAVSDDPTYEPHQVHIWMFANVPI